jgi:hypothetical protein
MESTEDTVPITGQSGVLDGLPALISVPKAAAILGLKRATAYRYAARVCQVNGVTYVSVVYFRPALRRPSKVMSKALRAAFHRLVQRLRPFPVGSRLISARYRHFRAACSVGK